MTFLERAYRILVDKNQNDLSDLLLQDHDSGVIYGDLGNNFLFSERDKFCLFTDYNSIVYLIIHTTMYITRTMGKRSLLDLIPSSDQT